MKALFLLVFCSVAAALHIDSNKIKSNDEQFWDVYKQVLTKTKHVSVVVQSHLVLKFAFFFQNPYRYSNTFQFVKTYSKPSSGVLLFVSSIDDLYKMVVEEETLWDGATRYLFVSLNCSYLINKTLSELWRVRKIYKAVLICDVEKFNTYMYIPLMLGPEGVLKKIRRNKDVVRFMKHGVDNLQGKQMRALMYPSDSTAIQLNGEFVAGTDWKALDLLSKLMNFTHIVSLPSDGTDVGNYKNGTPTGPFKDLLDGNADIVMIGHFLRNYKKQRFLLTRPVGRDCVSIVVPQATKLPHFKVIVQIFQYKIWWCLFLIYVIATLVNILIFKYSGLLKLKKLSPITVAFSMYKVIITGIINVRSKTISYRILLAFLFVFVLIFSNTFQGSLITFISMPLHYPNIDTIKDLTTSPLPIVISQEVWEEIYFEDPDMDDLIKKMRIETDLSKYAEGYLALFIRLPSNRRFLYKNYISYLYPESVRTFHIMEEYLIAFYLSYLLPENSPYINRVNRLLFLFEEHGLIQKWDKEVLMLIKSVFLPQNYDDVNEKQSKPFTLHDLDFAFDVLFFGLTFSTIIFIFEIVFAIKYKP